MPASVTFIDRNFDDALALMVEARNYVAYGDDGGGAPTTQLRFSYEAMRVTARLVRAAAWLATEKAVRRGELSRADARGDAFVLSKLDVCLDPSGPEDECLPNGLRSLLDRSHRLYMRVTRLEALVDEAA